MYLKQTSPATALTQGALDSGLAAVTRTVVASITGQIGGGVLTRTTGSWLADGFVAGQWVRMGSGLWTIASLTATDLTLSDGTDLTGSAAGSRTLTAQKVVEVTAADVPVQLTDNAVTVTPSGTDGGTVTCSTCDWVASGFVVGQLVQVQGLTGSWRLLAISGRTLTLGRGNPMTASTTKRTVFVPGPHGGLTTVHGGGNMRLETTFAMTVVGNRLVRTDGLPWSGAGYVKGNPYGTGPQHVWVNGASYTILDYADVDCATLGITDPWPDCGKGAALVLSGSPGGSAASATHVVDPFRIDVTGPMQIHTNYLQLTAGAFPTYLKVGMQVRISGLAGQFTISGFNAARTQLFLGSVALRPTVSVVNHLAVWSAPTLTVTGFDPLVDGGTRMGGDTINVCQTAALAYLGTPCAQSTPGGVVGGPTSPLVVYGDTSQDGTWYAGHAGDQLGYEFGPKPFDPLTYVPDAENEDDEWVFGLANPYPFAGNDIIDAHNLFTNVVCDSTCSNLPTVGITAYGGLGDDLLIGSQTGDFLAGGSGDDEIRGLRGADQIYGDSGVNVDILTRRLTIDTVDASPLPTITGAGALNNGTTIEPYPSPVRDDMLVAGRDVLYGEGDGTYGAPTGPQQPGFDDIVFGDHGAVLQNVADPNEPDERLQRIQTTRYAPPTPASGTSDCDRVLPTGDTLCGIESRNLQTGDDDVIFGGDGRDVLIGGAGDDMVDGGAQDDFVFGDNMTMARTTGNWTSPHFQTLCGTLLYSRSDRTNACGGVVDENNSGLLLTNGQPKAYRDPDGAPWWAEYDVLNLFHTTVFDQGTAGAGSFGNDYLAGGAHHDVILGQLGDDVIQGDGTISSAFRRMVDDAAPAVHVGASRTPTGCVGAVGSLVCDYVGALTTVSLTEQGAPTTYDGEDYIEGNAGNDVVFGGLGQDDIVGGSSDFFSLTSPALRPDGLPHHDAAGALLPNAYNDLGADLLFGGTGNNAVQNDDTKLGTAADVVHNRDADTIVGDNGRIIRIVGTNGQDLDTTPAGSPTTTAKYVTFNWDNYGATRQVVRGVHLLDYTVGGPDYDTNAFFKVGTTNCNGSPTQPTCSPIWTVSCANCNYVDIGGKDEVHGEAGDDTAYTGAGDDVLYGDAQDDDLIAGWGNDWMSGGTGVDTLLGDDGRILTSRNTSCGTSTAVCTQLAEPLYGVYKLRADPDTRTSQGDVLNEFIYTPGQVQTATINVEGVLAKAADLTIYNLGPNVDAGQHKVVNQPLYDANNSDDIIFGGWDDDFIHGGAGDDAVSGSEALASSYNPHFELTSGSTGLDVIDWLHPYNPGDVLHFGADTNAWHSNHHNAMRLGEFFLYDEYDPRRTLLFNTDGTVWKGGAAPVTRQFFLNNDPVLGHTVAACIAADNQGNCTAVNPAMPSDGNDVIFGDLGNDWSVGGTGADTIYGGWGNDLSNADDDLRTNSNLNDAPDGPNSSYQDRVYGGAGLDIMIANTGGDRLIDWVGEFNTYLVPFAPFGIATVSRQNAPALRDFLYALSKGQGADPTRATDTGNDPVRNGEPDGEMGLITQHDHGQWQTQTGGPTDPQAGNIPGGKRDTLRGADFNDSSLQAFAPDSGTWTVAGGRLSVTAASQGQDAVAVWYADAYLPIYYEISASISTVKPTSGWKSNSFVIFDYWSPTDFKFAGIDISTSKLVIGHRDAGGWRYDAQGSVPGGLKADTFYPVLVAVNGLFVTVSIGTKAFSYTFAPRLVEGDQVALNKGMLGFGSDNSRGEMDNVALQVIPPTVRLDTTNYFEDPVSATPEFTGYRTGSWTAAGGRYAGSTNSVDAIAISTAVYKPTGFDPGAYLEVETVVRSGSRGGVVFDAYATNDFKFVALDIAADKVLVGHVDPRRGWVVDASYARTLLAGTDYVVNLVLKGTVVTVTVGGSVLGSYAYNGAVVDGQVGLLSTGGASSFDRLRVRTDDEFFPISPPGPEVSTTDVSVAEGNPSGTATTPRVVTFTRTGPLTAAATFTWRTFDLTATAGSDYVAAGGTATFAAGASTATVTVQVMRDTVFENNEVFGVQILTVAGYTIARDAAIVTITNDDAQPAGGTAAVSPAGSGALATTTAFVTPADEGATSDFSKKGSLTITPNQSTGALVISVTGGGHRPTLQVRIATDTGYETVVSVLLDATGKGTVTVYPTRSATQATTCVVTLEDPQAIGRTKILGSLTVVLVKA